MHMEASIILSSAYAHLITLAIPVVLYCSVRHVCLAQTTEHALSEKITVCNEAYGTPIGQLEGIPSFLACAAICMCNAQCKSLLYDTATKSCKSNNDGWLCPNMACPGSGLLYAKLERPQNSLCQGTNICTQPIGGVRLCEGGGAGVCDPARGRVEIYYNSQWGTVCDDGWAVNAGNVVCSMFGYTSSELIVGASCIYGPDSTTIWVDDVVCSGLESSLFSCSHLPWGSHNCVHFEDVILKCW